MIKENDTCPLCGQFIKGQRMNREGVLWHKVCYSFSQEETLGHNKLYQVLLRYSLTKRVRPDFFNQQIEDAVVTWNGSEKRLRIINI